METPIIIFAYNRPKHLQRLIDSLRLNPECNDTDLYIFADGAKAAGDADVDAVREVVKKIDGFRSVTPISREKNIGLAANIIDGVSSTINRHGTAIVLEDDLVVTPFFLRYMDEALRHYKDSKAFSIAGYTPPIGIPNDYKYDTYAVMRNCSWGWATWQDRWNMVDWDVKNFNNFFADDDAVSRFNAAARAHKFLVDKVLLRIVCKTDADHISRALSRHQWRRGRLGQQCRQHVQIQYNHL